MNRQEVFNTVYRHMLEQGRKALAEDGVACRYYAPDGTRCAVGCLIKPEEYNRGMEDRCLSYRFLVMFGLEHLEPYRLMLQHMQDIHDRSEPETWEARLRGLATIYELEVPECSLASVC